MADDEKIKKLKLIKVTVNDALEYARSKGVKGAINWGDLQCVQVSHCVDDEGEEQYEALIEEASPKNPDLNYFIHEYIAIQSKVSIDRELVIRFEW